MTRYIAFLRAINVGGRRVKMDELRGHFEALGLASVETYIASGNVIFHAWTGDAGTLQKSIEAHLHAALGYEVNTFLRTDAEVAEIATYRPFDDALMAQAQALNVAFLAEPLDDEVRAALSQLRTEIDEFHANGREVYWLCRKKQSESTFSNVLFERKLRVPATFRGYNTVAKLAAKYPPG
jgi:uncharacterized protein (DUF1697 family)